MTLFKLNFTRINSSEEIHNKEFNKRATLFWFVTGEQKINPHVLFIVLFIYNFILFSSNGEINIKAIV